MDPSPGLLPQVEEAPAFYRGTAPTLDRFACEGPSRPASRLRRVAPRFIRVEGQVGSQLVHRGPTACTGVDHGERWECRERTTVRHLVYASRKTSMLTSLRPFEERPW